MVKLNAIMAVAFSLGCFSCANNPAVNNQYKFGDLSRAYCASTDPAFRQVLRASIESAGVVMPADYCLTYGLTDALLKTVKGGE